MYTFQMKVKVKRLFHRGYTYDEIGKECNLTIEQVKEVIYLRFKEDEYVRGKSILGKSERVVDRPGETWKPLLINPKYHISNLGRVKNSIFNTILRPVIDTKGYLCHRIDKIGYRTHRLMFETEHGRKLNPDEIINHKDFDKLNPKIDNLELTTIQGNCCHSANNMVIKRSMPIPILEYICKQLEAGRRDNLVICGEVKKLFNYDLTPNYVSNLRGRRRYGKIYIPRIDIVSKFKIEMYQEKLNRVTDEEIHKLCKILESGKIKTNYRDVLLKAGIAHKVCTGSYISKLFAGANKHITSLYKIENGRIRRGSSKPNLKSYITLKKIKENEIKNVQYTTDKNDIPTTIENYFKR